MTCKVPSSLRTSSMVMNIGLSRTWNVFLPEHSTNILLKVHFYKDIQLVKQVWKLEGPSEKINRKYVLS